MAATVSDVAVPHGFVPRSYQAQVFDAFLAQGVKRGILVWHRRAGKDKTALNLLIVQMLKRVGVYYYFFPTYAQGKKIMWDGIDGAGSPFLDHFPKPLIDGRWEDELKIKLTNGSIFQIIGTDKMDHIVGTNPVGCVFSEYSLQNPKAYDLVRPILRENRGWALFVYTPRGKNHGWNLWKRTLQAKGWFTSLLTVDDTRRDAPGEDGQPVVTPADVQTDREEGMSEALAQQEYYCSFEGALEGSYYGDQLTRARDEGRIGYFPPDPAYRVDTAWDLGLDDETVVIFTQTLPGRLRVVDCLASSGKGLEYYVRELNRKDYIYHDHFAPHDIKVREWGTGQSRIALAQTMGIDFRPVPKYLVEDGIQAGRRLMGISEFHEPALERFLDALASYRREWDDKLQTWKKEPVHDWASHYADAWRARATGWEEWAGNQRPTKAITWENPLDEHGRVREYDTDFSIWRA